MSNHVKSSAPAIVHKLVETFEQNLDSYRSTKNETELRREFLDKFFTALGWDVANEKAYDEAGKEVVHEFSVEISGQQKKADYAFRVGRGDKFDFLVEAKKPSVKIESNQDAAFQIRRYGWSAKLPINILTDFEHFAVYDCRAKPSYNDKAATGRILLIHYKEYVERWDEIASIFSPEAVRQGSFARYAEGTKKKRGTADVDDAFLQEIERWRELLAKNIALRNEEIDIAGLNYTVQMTIDRIVFLRICEERGIEPENQLLDLLTPSAFGTSPKFDKSNSGSDSKAGVEFGGGREGVVYRELCELFKRADTKYNSGLFHFKQEKEQASRADDLTLGLDIDDKVLKDIISNLYYPKSPYAFLYIPADILGQVYERFLGKVIRLTAGHNAKVEEKPEVRKAGGVYYTPTYIVDYIVKNTVGQIVNLSTPAKVAKLKIVDPACGSGTFLLGAYQFLLDWHLNWYVNDDAEKWEKSKAIWKVESGYKLTTSKKKEILLNNIHGVDIDAQAVEVTKLSLLLKVLENASGQLGLGMERVLPDLGNNIKCGNSLIGFDYFEGQLSPDEEERARVNPFDWKNEFKDVFAKGGFDAVIGNPPYGAYLYENDKNYIVSNYVCQNYQLDTYLLFLERAIKNLLRENGCFGMIIPNPWITNLLQTSTRKFVVESTRVSEIVHFTFPVFKKVTVDTQVVILQKGLQKQWKPAATIVDDPEDLITGENITRIIHDQDKWRALSGNVINIFMTEKDLAVAEQVKRVSVELQSLFEINVGIKPYQTGKGVPPQSKQTVENRPFDSDRKKGSSFRLYLRGSDIKRYEINPLEPRYIKYGVWLAEPRPAANFDAPEKIVMRQTGDSIVAALDVEQYLCLNNMHVIVPKDISHSVKYVLGVLNSNLVNWYYHSLNPELGEALAEVKKTNVAKLPIHTINFSDPAEKAQHDKMVSLVEAMLALHKSLAAAQSPAEKERLERQIQVTDKEIDSLVYELYGLTEEEIKIVEEE
ncbi:MAG: hypothetical protein HFACDABA_01256 [Anaerolineales bacterium]|nr:hypothetical protein [Anaerolineales bacterium]